jgi:hypothetical protein
MCLLQKKSRRGCVLDDGRARSSRQFSSLIEWWSCFFYRPMPASCCHLPRVLRTNSLSFMSVMTLPRILCSLHHHSCQRMKIEGINEDGFASVLREENHIEEKRGFLRLFSFGGSGSSGTCPLRRQSVLISTRSTFLDLIRSRVTHWLLFFGTGDLQGNQFFSHFFLYSPMFYLRCCHLSKSALSLQSQHLLIIPLLVCCAVHPFVT